jgi:hypothetical protein
MDTSLDVYSDAFRQASDIRNQTSERDVGSSEKLELENGRF